MNDRRHASVASFAAVGVAVVLVACGADKPSSDPSPVTGVASNTAVVVVKTAAPAPSAVASTIGTVAMPPTDAVVKVVPVTVSGVQLDPAVAAACKVEAPKAYFEYDSASLGDLKRADFAGLDALADCIGKGALKGKKIEVVGHTDERGDAAYNKALGKSRAQTVADYLVVKGADKAKLVVLSKGEEKAAPVAAKAAGAAGATGAGGAAAKAEVKAEAVQALAADRRVDVRIAK